MIECMNKYPVGSKVQLDYDLPGDEPHEVVGYKKIGSSDYLIFKDEHIAFVGRVVIN